MDPDSQQGTDTTMKKITMALLASIIAFTAATQANEVMPERDTVKRLLPTATPDPALFKSAMAAGTGSIEGMLSTRYRVKGGGSKERDPVSAQQVHLLPYNAYTQAWLDLYLKEGGSKEVRGAPMLTIATLDPSVLPFRRSMTTNSTGDFAFANVRPGRYVVYAEPEWKWEGSIHGSGIHRNITVGYRYITRVDFAYRVVDLPPGSGSVNADVVSEKIIYGKVVDEG